MRPYICDSDKDCELRCAASFACAFTTLYCPPDPYICMIEVIDGDAWNLEIIIFKLVVGKVRGLTIGLYTFA